MKSDDAIDVLSALAQQHRLAVFRLLIRQGRAGMQAGEIARQIGIPANTMSTHLGILARAGIVDSERESRAITYRINIDGVQSLFEFLVSDCCAGQPELCATISVIAQKALACCEEDDSKRSTTRKRKSK
jgi:ArsR family transcriptional regulator, arsenate/arsenite/antimonite-responsive transcriptional repressor